MDASHTSYNQQHKRSIKSPQFQCGNPRSVSPIQYWTKSEIWSQCLSLPHPPFPKQILGGKKNNVPEINVDQSPCSEKGIPPKNTWGKDPVAEMWFYIQE